MSDQGNKQIKLSVALDAKAFGEAKQALIELTKLAQDFVRTLNHSSGGLFGGAGNRAMGALGGSLGQTSMGVVAGARSSGGGGGGGGNPLVSAVLANKNLLQNASQDSKAAFKAMTSALRDAVSDETREINRLKREIDGLSQSLNAIPGKFGSARRVVEEEIADRTNALGDRQHNAQKINSVLAEQMDRETDDYYASYEVKRKKGLFQRIAGVFGGGGGGDGGGGIFGQLARQPVGPWAAMTGMAGAALHGMATGGAELQASQWDDIRRRLMTSGFSQQALRTRGAGDIGFMVAMNQALKTGDVQQLTSAENRVERGYGTIGGLNLNPTSGFGYWDVARKFGDMNQQQKADVLKRIQQEREANPLLYADYDQFGGTYQQRISNARTLGMGYRKIIPKGGGTVTRVSGAESFLTRGQALGFSDAETLGMFGQLEGHLGLGGAQSHTFAALSASAAHLNAVPFMGAVGAFENPSSAVSRLRQLIGSRDNIDQNTDIAWAGGRRGMDPAVASAIANNVAGMSFSGADITTPMDLTSMLAMARGGSTAEDLRTQKFMPQGLQALGGILGGGTDQYQQGMAVLAAQKAAGHLSVEARDYLINQGKDPAAFASLARGNLSPTARLLGLTPEIAQGYISSMASTAFAGYVPTEKTATPFGSYMQGISRHGGSASGYYLERVKMLTDAAKGGQLTQKQLQSEIEKEKAEEIRLGAVALSNRAGVPLEVGRAMMEGMLGMGGHLTGIKGKGRGGGDAGMGGAEADFARSAAAERARYEESVGGKQGELRGLASASNFVAKELNKMGQDISQDAAVVGDTLLALADAFNEARRSFNPRADTSPLAKRIEALRKGAANQRAAADKEAAGKAKKL